MVLKETWYAKPQEMFRHLSMDVIMAVDEIIGFIGEHEENRIICID